jgi:hypothetical protein
MSKIRSAAFDRRSVRPRLEPQRVGCPLTARRQKHQ